MTLDYFQQIQAVFNFNKLHEIDENMIVPMIKHFGNEPLNYPVILPLNKHIFRMNKRVALYALHFGVNKQKRFIKGYKAQDDEWEWLHPHLQSAYGWSDKEIQKNWIVIAELLKDKDYCRQLDSKVAFNPTECKLLGIEYIKPVFKEIKKKEKNELKRWF